MEVMKNPFCKPRKMSFPRIIEQFETIYIFIFILSSLNYSIDKNFAFFYVKTKKKQVVQKQTRETAKHKLQSGANFLDRCCQRFYNPDRNPQVLLARF
jgi:hypothetical protein